MNPLLDARLAKGQNYLICFWEKMKNPIGPQILSMFVFALFVGSKYDIWFIVIHAIYNGNANIMGM